MKNYHGKNPWPGDEESKALKMRRAGQQQGPMAAAEGMQTKNGLSKRKK